MTHAYTALLKQLEKRVAAENSTWNIDPTTGAFLQSLVRTNDYTKILEIGTSIGVSALYMAAAVVDTKGHITTVESHAARFQEAQKHIAAAEMEHIITQVHGHAPEILPEIEGSFDFLFFDATKMEHILYYQALKGRLLLGGTLVADNVLSHAESMAPFVQAVTNDVDFEVHIKDIGTGLLVARKIK